VVEHLLCKCEALSSNPSPTPVKKKKTEGMAEEGEHLIGNLKTNYVAKFL
jgi:hypothetical protein